MTAAGPAHRQGGDAVRGIFPAARIWSAWRGLRPSRREWLVASWLAAIALVGLWFCLSAGDDRRKALAEAERQLGVQTELAALDIDGKFESTDLGLRTAVALIGANPKWQGLAPDPLLWRILHDVAATMTSVPRMILVDAGGRLRLRSDLPHAEPLDLSDRDYFRQHRDHATAVPVLGEVVVGRISKVAGLPLTRRLTAADGSFLGVVSAPLDFDAVTALFRSLERGGRIGFALVRPDGVVLARHPWAAGAIGATLDLPGLLGPIAADREAGCVRADDEGGERLACFRRLSHFGLVVVAATPLDNALRLWRRQTVRMGWVIAGGLFLVTLAGLLLLGHVRAEAEARRRLAASEASLNRAQTLARVGSWQLHLPATVLTCSAEARRLFALPAEGPVSFETVLERVHPADRRRLLAALRRSGRGHPLDLEHRLLIDGAVRWIRLRAETAAEGTGEIVGTAQDITERRQAEESLRRQAEELARSNTELEQFAYVASHDLREPLRMIASFIDLLARRYGDRLDRDGLEFIAFARDGAARMDRLVLDLLDYSRIGRICAPMQKVALDPVLTRVCRALALKIAEAGAEVLPPAAPLPTVIGDPGELARLFQNLIDNAIKYRDPDRPLRVTLTAERQGGVWLLSVADTGIGIEPQYFERIFGIFQRLHTRDAYEGTGIGLAICKKIVERHGGRIWVDSERGQGSVFHFTLPAAEAG